MFYKPLFAATGRCSTFGGPHDSGVGAMEGLALIDHGQALDPLNRALFIEALNPTRGLARQLDRDALYCAMRWDYTKTSRQTLLRSIVRVQSRAGLVCWVRPVDWGPNKRTNRLIDLSPGAADCLSVLTDEPVDVIVLGPVSFVS